MHVDILHSTVNTGPEDKARYSGLSNYVSGESSRAFVELIQLPEHAFLREVSFNLQRVCLDIGCYGDHGSELASEMVSAVREQLRTLILAGATTPFGGGVNSVIIG